jgi:hypothetical protein
MILRRGTDP